MELKMKSYKKTYLLRYSVKDNGCDQTLRKVTITAQSLPYAIDKLTAILNGLYRNFVIIY